MDWGLGSAHGSAAWRAHCVSVGLLVLALPVKIARADAVLFPTNGDSDELVARLEPEIVATVRAALAERGEALEIATEIAAESGGALEDPCDLGCIERVLELAGAERALVVQLAGRGGSLASLAVVALDASGLEVAGEASARGRPLSVALRAALDEAFERWPARGGVLVEVVGSPSGASVLIDRAPFGRLPARGRLSLGGHRLAVVAPGYETARRALYVPLTDRLEIRVDLMRAGRSESAAGGRPRRAWVAGPVLLGAAGASLLAVGGAAFARRRCELEAANGTCVRGAHLDPLPFGLTVASGAAALVAATVWIPVGSQRGRAEASLGLGPGLGGVVARGAL